MGTLQDNIDLLCDRISGFNDEIATIDAYSSGHTGLQANLSDRRSTLVTKVNDLTSEKNALQTTLSNLNAGFTGSQQTTVDAINTLFQNRYQGLMNILKEMSSGQKISFFDLYDAATNDTLREIVIKSFFGL